MEKHLKPRKVGPYCGWAQIQWAMSVSFSCPPAHNECNTTFSSIFRHFLSPRSKTREAIEEEKRDSWKMSEEEASKHNGLIIGNTDAIKSFLRSASADPLLSPDLQRTASALASQTELPYKPLRALWFASPSETRPKISRLLYGSHFLFTSPKRREKVNRIMSAIQFSLYDRSPFSLFFFFLLKNLCSDRCIDLIAVG